MQQGLEAPGLLEPSQQALLPDRVPRGPLPRGRVPAVWEAGASVRGALGVWGQGLGQLLLLGPH